MNSDSDPSFQPRYRSGAAARLAGLPVGTLRVWERRYRVGGLPQPGSGHRLYSAADVARLSLMRQLAQGGHAIGTLATLPMAQLQALASLAPARQPAGAALPLVVVGVAVLARLRRAADGAAPAAVFADLDAAEAAPALPPSPARLVLQLTSLQPETAGRVLALVRRWGVERALVLHGFGPEGAAAMLVSAGLTVRREPVALADLAGWLREAERPQAAEAAPPPPAPVAAAARRFDDAALAELASRPSPVACECPRHLAELVAQLAGFEHYSGECQSRSSADAAIHRRLHRVTGQARALMEQALADLLEAEGLPMPTPLAEAAATA